MLKETISFIDGVQITNLTVLGNVWLLMTADITVGSDQVMTQNIGMSVNFSHHVTP